jgi:hypothetical protein
MIDIQELRVGNAVKFGSHILTVDGVLPNECWSSKSTTLQGQYIVAFKETLDKIFPWAITPVPLFEHRVLTLGYRSLMDDFYILDNVLLKKKSNSHFLYQTAHQQIIELRTVHRLQNLFFALTGKEICLKQTE